MKTCLNCEILIEEKTKSGKSRTFCGKSCARKYTCRTKPEVVQEANKRGYQTLLENAPEVIKHRGRSTEKKRIACEKNRYDVSQHAREGALAVDQKARKKTMIEKGLWIDYKTFDAESFKEYRRAATNLTRSLYRNAGEGFHWDHIVPVKYGFENDIPIELICSEENVKRVPAEENLAKGANLTQESMKLLGGWGAA